MCVCVCVCAWCVCVCMLNVCTCTRQLVSLQSFETSYESLKALIVGLSEQEITSALLAKVSKLGQDQEDVNYGLLCGIVTEPSSATEVSDNATHCF